ncbi:hypothetical protein VTN49DRAFT_2001 [Thermomyces lanuginosus]|uniref:uncharacterized protein n=1 Tax=Thermomyces lanuginosus TaxID=5541 RepID=UPI0037422065
MSPAADDMDDFDTQSSHGTNNSRGLGSPHSNTNSIEPSMNQASRLVQCSHCGKVIEKYGENVPDSDYEIIKEHIAREHPHMARSEDLDKVDPADGVTADSETGPVTVSTAVSQAGDGAELLDANGELPDSQVATAEATEAEKEEDGVSESANNAAQDASKETSEASQKNGLRDDVRQSLRASIEKRLEKDWNLHEVRRFNESYDEEIASIEQTWNEAYSRSAASKKSDSPDVPSRPNPYLKNKVEKGEFLEITPVEEYLELLRDPENLSYEQLYAVTANAAHALKTWQDEWQAIDRLTRYATRHMMKASANPRRTERPEVFEDKKEAMLYGYKHDSREFMIGIQDPFIQGGFRPTPSQLRKMRTAAGSNNPNPDGWKTIRKFGIEYAPKFQDPPNHGYEGKMTRKRKAAQSEAAALQSMASETNGSATPAVESDQEGRPAKRVTRSRAGKVVGTRDATQRQATPSDSGRPVSRSGSGRGGRGRGRGGTIHRPPSRASTASQSKMTTPVTTAAPAPTEVQAKAPVAPEPPAKGGTLVMAPSTTATSTAPSTTTTAPAVSSTTLSTNPDEVLDPAELARRQKIANSKNPRRTEAMLNHWVRFNREGRVRNPKRTKAQIEADKRAEAERKAREGPKEGGRKRKANAAAASASTDLGGANPPASKAPRLEPASSGTTSGVQLAPIQPATATTTSARAPPPPPPPSLPPPAPHSVYGHAPTYLPPLQPSIPQAPNMAPHLLPPPPPPPPPGPPHRMIWSEHYPVSYYGTRPQMPPPNRQ